MSIGMETDVGNQNFQGARNPDDLLIVKFFDQAQYNAYKSTTEGRPVYDNVTMISISTPGQALLNEIHRPKVASDEVRFQRQWGFFQQTHSNDPAKAGTPLSQWPLLNTAQAEMLKAVGFFTIEHVAFCSDDALGKIGMHAGMSPFALRDKATRFLSVARDASTVDHQAEEIKRRDAEIADLKARDAARDAQIAEMQAHMQKLTASQTEAPKVDKKKGYVMTPEHKAKMKAAREAKQASAA